MKTMNRLWMLVWFFFFNYVWGTYANCIYHCRCNLVPVYHYINIHRYRVRPGFLKYTLGQPSFIISTRLSFFLPSFLTPHDKNQKPKTKNTPHIHEFESLSACHCSCRNIDRHADRKLQQPGWKSGPLNVIFFPLRVVEGSLRHSSTL